MRSLYQHIGRFTVTHHKQNKPVRDLEGNLLSNDDAQIRRWRQHFMGISHTTSPNVAIDYRSVVPPSESSRIPSAPPNVREIVNAIKKPKHNRAAGEDNIPAELLQVDTQLMAEILHPHFSRIWEGETVPASWKSGIIVKLPKKGDLSDCNNWRGITLLNTSYKILATYLALNERLQEKIEPLIRDEQAGFRPHRSCVDQANILCIITEQAVEWKAPLYLLFIDFKKVFDSVERAAIWRTLARKGVPANLIAIIKSMYDDANLAVLHNGKTSAPFQTNTGIRQGCPLSPLLFNIVVDELMSEVCSSKRGITWNLTRHLGDLDYADDICLISQRLDDIQRKSDDLVRIASSAVRRFLSLERKLTKHPGLRVKYAAFMKEYRHLGHMSAVPASEVSSCRYFLPLFYHCVIKEDSSTTKIRVVFDGSAAPSTVTYGTKPASFLSVRAMQQLSIDEQASFPIGSEILRRDFHVDDLISGSGTVKDAISIMQQTAGILAKGKLKLRKWCSNIPLLLEIVPAEDKESFMKFEDVAIETLQALCFVCDC
ncbi:uncharacterized protein LOC122756630 [Drosophila santomea]|uniref:uncharacterized protein LOC122756630 n=1 Tax=Drosophila santomea TaxID=129105 RepID=UPI001CCC34B8|nr:uncharacterized protein LOC122756630 [Drosophila santomea]